MTTLRCSRLDDVFTCPASVLSPASVQVSIANEAAEIGKCVHAIATEIVLGNTPHVMSHAQQCGLGAEACETVSELVRYLVTAWHEISKYFPTPKVETVVNATVNSTLEIEGTIDLLSPVGPTSVIFADWKTGYADDGHRHQMNGYAYCVWDAMGRPDDVLISGIVVYLRHRYYRVEKWDARRLLEWEYDLTHNIMSRATTYGPGPHCSNCPNYAVCPARIGMVESTLDAMLFGGTAGPGTAFAAWLDQAKRLITSIDSSNKNDPVVADAVIKLMSRVRMAEDACADARKMVRDAVERVGPIQVSESSAMVIREQERKSLEPRLALPVLRARLSDQQICECMSLSLTKLASQVSSGLPTGRKGTAKGILEKELGDAGAIIVETIRKLEEVDLTSIKEQDHGGSKRQHSSGLAETA